MTSTNHSPFNSFNDLPFPNCVFTAPLSSTSTSNGRPSPSIATSSSNRRRDDPSYIPRPENAFILFRKDAVRKIREAERSSELESRLSSHPCDDRQAKRQRQADISKQVGQLWKSLSKEEKAEWEGKAAILKLQHEAKHPDYRYSPGKPHASHKRSKKLARIRKSKDAGDDDSQSVSSESLSAVAGPARRPQRSRTSSTASCDSLITPKISIPSLNTKFSINTTYETVFPSERKQNNRIHGWRHWIQPSSQDSSALNSPSDDVSPALAFRKTVTEQGASYAVSNDLTIPTHPYTEQSVNNTFPTHDNVNHGQVIPDTKPTLPHTQSEIQQFANSSAITNRRRSLSHPEPLLTQPTPLRLAPPSFNFEWDWFQEATPEQSPTLSDSLGSSDSQGTSPYFPSAPLPMQPDDFFMQATTSVSPMDIYKNDNVMDLNAEEWMRLLEQPALDFSSVETQNFVYE